MAETGDSGAGADRLYNDPALVRFYDLENEGGDDIAWCAALAAEARSVLDLGCGTGLFLAGLGHDCLRVGVDVAAHMLDVARQREGGDRVAWIDDDARRVRLDRRFDLVVLTGHAFQVFLGDDDQRAVLATIAAYLAPAGRFIFDCRNPLRKEWLEWTPKASRRRLHEPGLGDVDAWNDAVCDPATGIVTYATHYQAVASGEGWSASSRIRFTPRDAIAERLQDAGLAPCRWLGDWTGAPFTPAAPEIIPFGGPAQGRLRRKLAD